MVYGRVEVRAQVPKGDWLWPGNYRCDELISWCYCTHPRSSTLPIAIWMLPLNNEYGGWPSSGEIDIMESRGNLDYVCGTHEGHQKMGSTLHWGPDSSQNAYYLTSWSQLDEEEPFGDSFRLYGLEWSPDGIRFTLDGELTGEVYPPDGGFWELGGFSGNNIWENGSKMAPFDKEVIEA